jgi:hypothetical protein
MNKRAMACYSPPTLKRLELTEGVKAMYRSKAQTAEELANFEALVRGPALRRAS